MPPPSCKIERILTATCMTTFLTLLQRQRERGRKHKQRKGNFKRKRALGKGQMFYAASYCAFFPSTYVPSLTFPFFPYYFVFLSNCLLSLFSSHRSAIYYLFLSFHTTLSFSICLITLFPLDLSGFCFFF